MTPVSKVPHDEMQRVRAQAVEWQRLRLEYSESATHELVLRMAELESESEEQEPSVQPEFENVVIGFKIPIDPATVAQPLALLHDAKRGVDVVESSMDSIVVECRRRGYSWADIATALDVTRQSAWTKYASLETPRSVREPRVGS